MATVPKPESVPCKFDLAWRGQCGKPTTNGWCDEHEKLTCTNCGDQATRSCDHTGLNAFVCDTPLCANCDHSPKGSGHVSREEGEKILGRRKEENEAQIASRTSPKQRVNEETGLPLNLFELKKGDMAGYELRDVFAAELQHGLWGYFPAIYRSSRKPVVTLNRPLLARVLKTLSPRRFKVNTCLAWVDEESQICYPEQEWQLDEDSTPVHILTTEEFEELVKTEDQPFMWTPGLVSNDMAWADFADTVQQITEITA